MSSCDNKISTYDEVTSCQLVPITIKCVTFDNTKKKKYSGTKTSFMQTNEPIAQQYTHHVIDTSKYCGTPIVKQTKDDCPYGTLCCTIPDDYTYTKKRFYATGEEPSDACNAGVCVSQYDDGGYYQPALHSNYYTNKPNKLQNKACYNYTNCYKDIYNKQQKCVDQKFLTIDERKATKNGWEEKSVYEVQQQKNDQWEKITPYTKKSKHPYYIHQEKLEQDAAAAAKKIRDTAAAAAKAKQDAAAAAKAKQIYDLQHPLQTLLNKAVTDQAYTHTQTVGDFFKSIFG